MKKPAKTEHAIIAAREAIAYLLNQKKLDPWSESFSKVVFAASYLFDEDVNVIRKRYGSFQLKPSEIADEEFRLTSLMNAEGRTA